ncbi:hypothetical protein O1611_g1401 [Lasiodiplodia mahajangana]|uniref:Uncharacterized protein n=1 Tax=Lasiodiplodia mahajangana TaxID=1108764 RepID=A0ACC2JXP0_9PEZI|nr:hypothetical protein O1611_g1401 [Lasiodiplodia mahajangana]
MCEVERRGKRMSLAVSPLSLGLYAKYLILMKPLRLGLRYKRQASSVKPQTAHGTLDGIVEQLVLKVDNMDRVLLIPELLESILLHLDPGTLLDGGDDPTPPFPMDPEFQKTLTRPEADIDSPGLRMGTLYNIVQHHTGHHTRGSRWFRVVWDRAREPYGTPSAIECSRRLLKHTKVMVEFYHMFDYVIEHREPQDASPFDKRFRSEAYPDINIDKDD